jgi:hypothetical protein
MNLLCDLPADVLEHKVLEFLELYEYCRLDSAFCSENTRNMWLKSLSEVVLSQPIRYLPTLNWIIERKVKLRHIYLNDRNIVQLGAKLINFENMVNMNFLEILTLECTVALAKPILWGIEKYTKRKVLICLPNQTSGHGVYSSDALRRLWENGQADIHWDYYDPQWPDYIPSFCHPQIVSLRLFRNLQLVQTCSNLRKLKIYSLSKTQAEIIFQCCPLLTHLHLRNSDIEEFLLFLSGYTTKLTHFWCETNVIWEEEAVSSEKHWTQGLPRVTHLRTKCTPSLFSKLEVNCPLLQHLYAIKMHGCSMLPPSSLLTLCSFHCNFESYEPAKREGLIRLFESQPHLTDVCIASAALKNAGTFVTKEEWAAVLYPLRHQVRKLTLFCRKQVEGMIILIQSNEAWSIEKEYHVTSRAFRQLRSLTIPNLFAEFCPAIGNTVTASNKWRKFRTCGYTDMLENCKKFHDLEYHQSKMAIQTLLTLLPNLQEFCLMGNAPEWITQNYWEHFYRFIFLVLTDVVLDELAPCLPSSLQLLRYTGIDEWKVWRENEHVGSSKCEVCLRERFSYIC